MHPTKVALMPVTYDSDVDNDWVAFVMLNNMKESVAKQVVEHSFTKIMWVISSGGVTTVTYSVVVLPQTLDITEWLYQVVMVHTNVRIINHLIMTWIYDYHLTHLDL